MGLGLQKKYRSLYIKRNIFKFWLRKKLLGFDIANQFIQRVDKQSLQLILKKNGATIGNNCDLETGLTFHNCKDYSNLIIGNNCHIGKNCFFDLRDKVIIGDNCVISMQTTFITHIDMEKSKLTKIYPTKHGPIRLKNDIYVGAKAIILMDTEIREKSMIAAGSLITKSVNNNTLAGGVPAKPIKEL
jgi:acetyltransferase-like isoleucine patch superfamily enzyme